MKELDFKSFDGQVLKCYQFEPKGEIKGIVQIVHGLEEHGKRYSDLAEYLTAHGYLVFTCDQRLHGQTAEKLGETDIKNVFPVMVKDQILISKMLIDKYKKPLVILGHSYGSFLTQSYLQNFAGACGAILCGSAYMKRLDVFAGNIVARITRLFMGGRATAKSIEKLVYGGYNKKLKTGSWICANNETVKKYEEDELCGHPLCANFYVSMFSNCLKLYKKKNIAKINKKMPILIASGKDDAVGKMGKSTTKLYQFYKNRGLNASLKLYDGMRHEIFNEKDKQRVYKDFLDLIDQAVSAQQ